MKRIDNQEWFLPLIELFNEHGGYWDINCSEDNNVEISWSPFIGTDKGMLETIHMKRVYDIKDFYHRCVLEIEPHIGRHLVTNKRV